MIDSISCRACRQDADDALQLEPRAEQLLNDMVVQVTCNATAVLQQNHPLLVGLRRGKFHRQAGLPGKVCGELQIRRSESDSAGESRDDENT